MGEWESEMLPVTAAPATSRSSTRTAAARTTSPADNAVCPAPPPRCPQCSLPGSGGHCIRFSLPSGSSGRVLGTASYTATLGVLGDKAIVPSLPSTLPEKLLRAPTWIPESARAQVAQQDQWQQLARVCHNNS